ncbi:MULTISPECIES: hypothetical protein [Pseudomonadota]|jgi:hypothetical protein|uniref:hypothetical protein n=1 Tax=Pseudomonadota TaxID=1224 RepID=UPI00261A97AC|nr:MULTISPECIES: hypothetical protein [Pseudomonadota]
MNFTEVLEALKRASGFELYRLSAAIDRMLCDPKWIIAIRRVLHVGQQVEYFDEKDNRLCTGRVLELRQKTVLLQRLDTSQRWLMPYTSINLGGIDAAIRDNPDRGLSRQEVAVGDIVGFLDREQRLRSGKIIRINDKTVTIVSQNQRWRVPYALLHRIVDGDSTTIHGEIISR